MKRITLTGLALLLSLSLTSIACDDENTPDRDPNDEIAEIGVPLDMDEGVDAEPTPLDQEPSPVDAGEVDLALPPRLDAPRARVFLRDPISDEGELTEVELQATRFPDGSLTSNAVTVFNCLNEEGGLSGEINMGINIEVSLCREEQVVRPDPDGHYLSIEPPQDYTDPNDTFAEIMMYYHVNEIADYYLAKHEFSRYQEPLPALVNVQLKTNPALPFEGLRPGPDGFIPLDNALFFPQESWEVFADQFGLPPRDTDLIVFFQGAADFSYDASVIYHEYTHAVIGIDRLQGTVLDRYGVDASPGGMNEGLADYFAATALNLPTVGLYGIGTVNGGEGRDLEVAYRCPQDSHWEVHVHGRVIGSALWAARTALGAEIADRVMFDALELFTTNTTHQEASELLLVEAEEEGVEVADQLREILLEYGMLDCVRSRPWVSYQASTSRDRVPYAVPGTQSVGIPSLRVAGIPAHKQFFLDATPELEAGTEVVGARLSWRVAVQSLGFGAPSSPEPLNMAMRFESPVELELSPARYVADRRFTAPLLEGIQRMTLDKTCLFDEEGLPRVLHTLFINKAPQEHLITEMEVEWLTAIPEDEEVYFCPLEVDDSP